VNRSDTFEVATSNGSVKVTPRGPSDDGVLLYAGGYPKGTPLTRQQVEGMREWLGRWLAEGWN
jgi:hypothetical protein